MAKNMFIHTTPEDEAVGKLREIYEGDRKKLGYVPNYAKVFSLRPEVLEAWRAFQGTIRRNIQLRRYELVTLAVAMDLNCRYCILAHGTVLLENGFSINQLRDILRDFRDAGLSPAEVEMMSFARKISRNANDITQDDVDALREFNLEDVEILDITLTATLRSFASKMFDALGARSDAAYNELELRLSDLLP